MLTEIMVRNEVNKIRAIAGDDEVAHADEDDLHQKVLRAIADGTCDNPAACAKAALETLEIEFERWCA